MPLSKKKQAEYMRNYRARYNVIPKELEPVIPKDEYLRVDKVIIGTPDDSVIDDYIPEVKPVLYRAGKKYAPGTQVRDLAGNIRTAPELDGSGEPIW